MFSLRVHRHSAGIKDSIASVKHAFVSDRREARLIYRIGRKLYHEVVHYDKLYSEINKLFRKGSVQDVEIAVGKEEELSEHIFELMFKEIEETYLLMKEKIEDMTKQNAELIKSRKYHPEFLKQFEERFYKKLHNQILHLSSMGDRFKAEAYEAEKHAKRLISEASSVRNHIDKEYHRKAA